MEGARSLEELAVNWREWLESGEPEVGHDVLTAALLADARPSRERAICLYADGLYLFRLGDEEASRARNEEALATAREVGDAQAESLALVGLSRVAFREGRHDTVVELARAARELAAPFGSQAEMAPLHMHAAGTRLLGDYDAAANLYRESLDLARAAGNDRGVAMEQHNLGHVELHRGNLAEAERLFAARSAFAGGSSDPYEQAMSALDEAALAAARGLGEEARRRHADARLLLAEHGITLDPDDAYELQLLDARVA